MENKMKKIFLGLLVLGSISGFGSTQCALVTNDYKLTCANISQHKGITTLSSIYFAQTFEMKDAEDDSWFPKIAVHSNGKAAKRICRIFFGKRTKLITYKDQEGIDQDFYDASYIVTYYGGMPLMQIFDGKKYALKRSFTELKCKI
jgi:hypothetical protein